MMIVPTILSGGSGTRLWPLSRQSLPKQLLALVNPQTMLQETVTRLNGLAIIGEPVIVCSAQHRTIIATQLKDIGVRQPQILLEPIGRNTAPAVTVAALHILSVNPDALLLVLPADHIITDTETYHRAILHGVNHAKQGKLITFGIVPQGPETGYGYIKRGDTNLSTDKEEYAYRVDRFVEKPDIATAKQYIETNHFFWNSGMFLFQASRFLAEMEKYQPEMLSFCRTAIAKATNDNHFTWLDHAAFEACPSNSIDYAIMEKTNDAVVIPLDANWSDVGSWPALWQVAKKDDNNNVICGDVIVKNVTNSYVRSDNRLTVVIGVDDLIVVETRDVVMVAHKDHAQDVKNIVDQLKQQNRSEAVSHQIGNNTEEATD